MGEQARMGQQKQGKGATMSSESNKRELEPQLWQRHVEEEMERRAREHTAAPELAYFAEEYAEVAMRGIDATPNEYRRAEEEGQRHGTGDTSGNLADASDIAGG